MRGDFKIVCQIRGRISNFSNRIFYNIAKDSPLRKERKKERKKEQQYESVNEV